MKRPTGQKGRGGDKFPHQRGRKRKKGQTGSGMREQATLPQQEATGLGSPGEGKVTRWTREGVRMTMRELGGGQTPHY